MLDLPGIIEGAASGRGRGRQVVAVAKTADLILIILDVNKAEQQKRLLEVELDAIGIRLNKKKPDILLKPKKAGGISITHTVPLTKIDEKTIRTIVGFSAETLQAASPVFSLKFGGRLCVRTARRREAAQHGRVHPRRRDGRR